VEIVSIHKQVNAPFLFEFFDAPVFQK
jgi:hypothetical protein